jgi:TrmH family RNA methyltransferase
VPTSLGAHNPRIDAARDLLTKKGRKQHGRYSFEGATLLEEAHRAGVPIETLYVTRDAYERTPLAQQLDANGVPVYIVDDRAMKRLSDVETPAGIVAVAPMRLASIESVLGADGVVLLLADVSDPGNAGTLLRTAEAFGIRGVIAGTLGAEPHLPKVVRSAMGAVFRLSIALSDPDAAAPHLRGRQVTGLVAGGEPLAGLDWAAGALLAVGNERHGLGRWEALCTRLAAIPMSGNAESLNAAVAGSIALYEATKHRHV